ncbi:MAG: DUF2855 family protein [Phreatobacter sp.]
MAAALAARPMLGTAAFEVRRDDLRSTRLIAGHIDTASEVAAGRAVVAVDRFALIANTITYAAFGEKMAYWRFFPASDGYGRIPVWGFADVMASGAEGLAEGERLFGSGRWQRTAWSSRPQSYSPRLKTVGRTPPSGATARRSRAACRRARASSCRWRGDAIGWPAGAAFLSGSVRNGTHRDEGPRCVALTGDPPSGIRAG